MNGFSTEEDSREGPPAAPAAAPGYGQSCCLIEDGERCVRPAGNASFSKRVQKSISQKKLKLDIDKSVSAPRPAGPRRPAAAPRGVAKAPRCGGRGRRAPGTPLPGAELTVRRCRDPSLRQLLLLGAWCRARRGEVTVRAPPARGLRTGPPSALCAAQAAAGKRPCPACGTNKAKTPGAALAAGVTGRGQRP